MKTLILNGSPRHSGNTVFLINMLKKYLKGEIDVINVYDMTFSACTDCRKCIDGGCIFNDDASDMINNMDSFDNIVIATPLYYNQPTGVLMALMSRNQIIFNNNIEMKNKKGGIIITGGGNAVVDPADCEKTLRIVLKSYNTDVKAYVRSLTTDRLPSCEDKQAARDIINMANVLNG